MAKRICRQALVPIVSALPLCPPLREQQAGLNSLSKPNFISKDCTLREGTSEGEEGSLHLMRIQIHLRVGKHRREFFDAIRGAALGKFVREILRVIVGQLHNINEFLTDHFEAGPSRHRWAESWWSLENISGHCRKGK